MTIGGSGGGPGRIAVPYLPFVDADNCDLALFPDYIRRCLEITLVERVPGLADLTRAESILRLYLSDIEYLILPEAHRDAEGFTFTNISCYTTASAPAALSEDCGGVSRTTVSMGMVRQLAGLAHAAWQVLVPVLFGEDPPEPAVSGLDMQALLELRQLVDQEAFEAIVRPYPRLLGLNADHEGGYESEYVLFADMLRFTWCHEWLHGPAGHTRAMRQRFGVSGLGEVGGPGRAGPGLREASVALTRRAFEFEADAIAVNALVDLIPYRADG